MNLQKSQTLLVISILLCLLGVSLFNMLQVAEPVLANIVPTNTPRRVLPTATPRHQAPRNTTQFKVFLPFVASNGLDSFTLINQDFTNGVIDINQATTHKIYALFNNSQLPSRYQSSTLIPEHGTPAFYETAANWNQLDATTRQTLADFLTPKDSTI